MKAKLKRYRVYLAGGRFFDTVEPTVESACMEGGLVLAQLGFPNGQRRVKARDVLELPSPALLL